MLQQLLEHCKVVADVCPDIDKMHAGPQQATEKMSLGNRALAGQKEHLMIWTP